MLINSQVSLHWPVPRRRRGVIARISALLRRWGDRRRQRAELARLDPRDWRDFGQSEADVYREVAKWFWQE
jgi:uncharacterized protein YjiS (DUF1127 family)